ncbi:RHS repeat protein [Vibrio navarrensis]|uniref:RHS repeat protein n=1 Tax=Vibrio navarrensis TaxID=29495 RepID=UPI001558AB0C|nr:RHS repeat protein [Vibrio navarrensis]
MNKHDIAQLCQGTPSIAVLDNRGLTVREVQFNRTRTNGDISDLDTRITRHTYTSSGHLETSIDPRFFTQKEEATTPESQAAVPTNFIYVNSLSGQPLCIDSIDAGCRMTLADVTAAPLLEWDTSGTLRRFEYQDALHRPSAVFEQNAAINGGREQVTERFVYADRAAETVAHNLNGQLVRHYDNAGLKEIDSLSLTGQVLSESRQLLQSETDDSDWQGETEASWKTKLASEVKHTTRWRYTALGEVLQQTDAKGNRQRMTYYVSGHLKASHLTPAGEGATEQTLVSDLVYSAHGQKLKEVAGNGVVTEYTYDDDTLRLSRVKTTRPAKAHRATLLQDLRYHYDPVGNVLKIEDKSVAPRYYKNQQVSASNHYEYDALYQLTQATGRENDSNRQQGASLPALKTPIPSDSHQYLNYTRTYRYDRGGNLQTIQHNGASRYTNTLVVSNQTNRAVQQRSSTESPITPEQVDRHFDAHGNMRQLEHSKTLSWGRQDQLKQVHLTDQRQEHYQYSTQGQRIRKTCITAVNSVSSLDEESRLLQAALQRLRGGPKGDGVTTRRESVVYLPGLELRQTSHHTPSERALREDRQVITAGKAGRCQVRVQHWAVGKPAEIDNNQWRYGLDNHLGSSHLELSQEADILTREEYYPFGGTAVWSAKSQTEAKYKIVRYSGKERDATGLYYYGYRYYASWMGRWLNPDPAWTVDGLNLFRMVRNNPVTLHDVDGRMLQDSEEVASPTNAVGGAAIEDAELTRAFFTEAGWKKKLEDLGKKLKRKNVIAEALAGAKPKPKPKSKPKPPTLTQLDDRLKQLAITGKQVKLYRTPRSTEREFLEKGVFLGENGLLDRRSIAQNTGMHYGDFNQALHYGTIDNAPGKEPVFEFPLKPGAHEILFDPDFTALYPSGTVPRYISLYTQLSARKEFPEAGSGEGTRPGFIGIKSETHGDAGFSISVSNAASKELLWKLFDLKGIKKVERP